LRCHRPSVAQFVIPRDPARWSRRRHAAYDKASADSTLLRKARRGDAFAAQCGRAWDTPNQHHSGAMQTVPRGHLCPNRITHRARATVPPSQHPADPSTLSTSPKYRGGLGGPSGLGLAYVCLRRSPLGSIRGVARRAIAWSEAFGDWRRLAADLEPKQAPAGYPRSFEGVWPWTAGRLV
jgi:hypothetical protein